MHASAEGHCKRHDPATTGSALHPVNQRAGESSRTRSKKADADEGALSTTSPKFAFAYRSIGFRLSVFCQPRSRSPLRTESSRASRRSDSHHEIGGAFDPTRMESTASVSGRRIPGTRRDLRRLASTRRAPRVNRFGGERAGRSAPLAPRVGFEPTTLRLTAGCSTVELSGSSESVPCGSVRPTGASPRASLSAERAGHARPSRLEINASLSAPVAARRPQVGGAPRPRVSAVDGRGPASGDDAAGPVTTRSVAPRRSRVAIRVRPRCHGR